MIKNVVFDIGNVLVDFCWEDFLHGKGFEGEVFDRIVKASVLSPSWNEFDRGVLSEAETLGLFIAAAPDLEQELHLAYDDIVGMIRRRDNAIPWVRALKAAGYGVYYLSNFSDKAFRECNDCLDFLPLMDGGIMSYREKLLKPDAAIYELLTGRYGLVPEECVFIDDTQKNVEGAIRCGWSAIRFDTYPQVEAELKALGVEYSL